MRTLLFFLIIVCVCACHSRRNKAVEASTQTDVTTIAPTKDTTPHAAPEPDESIPDGDFKTLVGGVPITPLPFGETGIDTMVFYKALGQGLPPIEYDSLNRYGLNTYFHDHEEKAVEYFSEKDKFLYLLWDILHDDGWKERFYFMKRFPPKEEQEYLLYCTKDSKEEDYWLIIICNHQTGVIKGCVDLSSASRYRYGIGCINKQYDVKRKYFSSPRKSMSISEDCMFARDRTDVVDDEVNDLNCTILIHDGKTEFVWIRNQPVALQWNDHCETYLWKRGDNLEIVRRRIDSLNQVK